MAENVCPIWVGYLLASPIRKLLQDPEKILSPHIKPGMTVMDIGCAMGFFTLPMARMTGPEGKVICVDVQEKMLQKLRNRALKAGLEDRLDMRVAGRDTLGIDDMAGSVDFALASAVVHEVPDQAGFMSNTFMAMKPGALFMFSEPAGHVSKADFKKSLDHAVSAGFSIKGETAFRKTHSALLERPA